MLLVVAANEAPMPQTREHLQIVDLFAIERGIIALSESDLVNPDRIAKVGAALRGLLVQTRLSPADILPVSIFIGRSVTALEALAPRSRPDHAGAPCKSAAFYYVPVRAGTDIAWQYVRAFINASFFVKPGFGFLDGLFTGFTEQKRDYDHSSWAYEIGDDGYAKVHETPHHPGCVFRLMKAYCSSIRSRWWSSICSSPKDRCARAETAAPDGNGRVVARQ